MAISLVIGNGINRLNHPEVSWEDILLQLSANDPSRHALKYIKQKPFALLYEEILLSNASDLKDVNDFAMKKQIAVLVDAIKANEFHRRVMAANIKHVITTNYDYNLERTAGRKFPANNLQAESKYSVFRRRMASDKSIWHIHGEASTPNTITLGYDQYSGYLQKLRNYATAEREMVKGSPFKRSELDFDERADCLYSWLDIFFRDDVHIVGLGLDFTEIDLWWALTYKRRLEVRGFKTGSTYFHDWHRGVADDAALGKRSLLTGLGVNVSAVNCEGGFEDAYDSFLTETLRV